MQSNVGILQVTAALVLISNMAGCCKREDAATTDPSPALSSSAAAADASTPLGPKVEIPSVARRTLKAGTVDGEDVWLSAFDAQRPEDTAGKGWLDARKACADEGLEMCTELQWVQACHDDASLGNHASWTMTGSGEKGFVVRGGDGCSVRGVAAGFDKQQDRGVLCCKRSIGIRTTNTNKAFLMATSGRLANLEAALNRHDAAGVAALFDDQLRFYQSNVSRERAEALMSGSFRQYPDQWAVHDVCDVSLQSTGDVETDTWTADCGKLVYRAGEVGLTKTVYVFGGPKTKLRSLTEPRILRAWSPP
jgi:hypothetical protein